jgi:hypothetical protein
MRFTGISIDRLDGAADARLVVLLHGFKCRDALLHIGIESGTQAVLIVPRSDSDGPKTFVVLLEERTPAKSNSSTSLIWSSVADCVK